MTFGFFDEIYADILPQWKFPPVAESLFLLWLSCWKFSWITSLSIIFVSFFHLLLLVPDELICNWLNTMCILQMCSFYFDVRKGSIYSSFRTVLIVKWNESVKTSPRSSESNLIGVFVYNASTINKESCLNLFTRWCLHYMVHKFQQDPLLIRSIL